MHCATSLGEVAAARNLVAMARQAGGPHLVYTSIVGVDRVPFSYYKSKLATEQLIAASELPWTLLRATQFHNLIFSMCAALARPAGCRTWPDPRSTRSKTLPPATCERPEAGAGCYGCRCRARPRPLTAGAGTWPRNTRPAR